ncbi:hypothetical protein MLD38_024312 [Melastoma candidum]|uniref:Uncharacterized protein n=1 Tax=Melastoma candidum TaxID=119954 RepID=A0ACB9NSW6_9MYRT|nr:hypothetical protein MLD38_024312 [Melastoma candidum]
MAAFSSLLFRMAVAGFTKVSKEVGNTYIESPDISLEDTGGGMGNEEKMSLLQVLVHQWTSTTQARGESLAALILFTTGELGAQGNLLAKLSDLH